MNRSRECSLMDSIHLLKINFLFALYFNRGMHIFKACYGNASIVAQIPQLLNIKSYRVSPE